MGHFIHILRKMHWLKKRCSFGTFFFCTSSDPKQVEKKVPKQHLFSTSPLRNERC